MESAARKLQQIGLTEYEAIAYLSLLNTHLNTAAKISQKSGVPRTKVYQVLESLEHKGWIRIYSGIPLLFKAVDPRGPRKVQKRLRRVSGVNSGDAR